MRNSNNAMTFLLAQYRAIFKRAYFKGLAAAVLMTAGLAAGAAQAAELSTGFQSGSVITATNSGDTFKSGSATASSLTVNSGASLTTSGAITVNGNMTLNGDLTIESGSILLTESETVGENKNQAVYRHSLTGTGADLDLTGNIGTASFELSNGSLELKSGGDGNTNLTAYGSGWNQTTMASPASDYDRDTANGSLTNMTVTVNSGTNVAALNHLRITGGSEVTLSGAGTSGSVSSENTAYLEGSRQLTIDDSKVTVSGTGWGNGIFSQNGTISGSELTIASGARLLIAGNADDYTAVLSGTADANAATYTLSNATITNSGTLQLGTVSGTSGDTFTIMGGELTNTGTIDFQGTTLNLDSALTNDIFGGTSGSLTLAAGAQVVVTGDDELDLSDVTISGTATDNKKNLTVGANTSWTQNNVKLGTSFDSANLKLDVQNLTAETNPSQTYASGDNAFILKQGDITVSNSLSLVDGADAIAGEEHRIYVVGEAESTTATLNLSNDGSTTGSLENVDRVYVSYASASGSSALNVEGAWDFGGARLAVNTSGTANLNGNINNVSILQMDNAGVVNVGSNTEVTVGRLMGSVPGATGSINLNGTLTIQGDGKDDKGTANYSNDISLTTASVNINNGGTFAITTKDALDDFITVTTDEDTGEQTVSVISSGDKTTDNGGWLASKVTLNAGGTLELNLGALGVELISTENLGKLKDGLVNTDYKGSFDFGSIKVKLEPELESAISSGSVSYKDLADADINDVQGVAGIENAKVTVTSSEASSGINLSNGAQAVELASGTTSVKVDGSLMLNSNSDGTADSMFVYTQPATASGTTTVASVSVAANSGVNLTGAGTVGALTAAAGATGTSAVLTAGEGAEQLVQGEIDLEKVTVGTGSLTVTEDVTATTLTLNGNLNNTAEAGTNSVTAETLTQAQGTTLATNDLTIGSSGDGTVSQFKGVVTANSITMEQATGSGANTLTIDGGSVVTAESFTAASGNTIYVGSDDSAAGTGSLSITTMDLNGADIIVDPAMNQKASFVGVKDFSDSRNTYDAGMLDGNAYALMNSILAIGESDEAQVRALFASYLNDRGSLSGSGIDALVYVAESVGVADGYKIVVDGSTTLGASGTFNKANYDADLTIKNGGVLSIDVTAAAKDDTAALNFVKDNATIEASSDAKIVLTGDYTQYDTLTLFQDGDGDGLAFEANGAQSITVETLSGLLQGTYSGTTGTFDVSDMTVNPDKVPSAYTDTSSAVRHSVISYLAQDTAWDVKNHVREQTKTHGARADGIVYYNNDFYYAPEQEGQNPSVLVSSNDPDYAKFLTTVQVKNPDYDPDDPSSSEYMTVVYEKAYNAFLEKLVLNTASGAAADAAAHMADFAGVAQVALKAGASTYEAISGRMGMGAAQGNLTFANNGQGAGIWVTPIYQSSDSDGFEAQGVSYGADISLYGVALGGDYTLANGVRVGALFNVGSGDADGQGAGSAVSSDFDYYGFGLYAGYSFGQFSVVGDVSYTVVDNNVEANTGIDKLKTSLDAANLSFGVTGAYAFESAAGISVTPHVGLRYSYLDLDDYTVEGSATGTVGSYDSDGLSVFSIPVGVTIASEFKTGSWSIQPSFDLTLTGNFGDDENEGTFKWAGVENIDSAITSEVFDNFTYGATLGIAAQSEAGISLGLTVGYTGSSNVDDLSVGANARFTF